MFDPPPKQSLAISEKYGIEHGAAKSLHHLGIIAEKKRDFLAAEHYYRHSLVIKEKHSDEHGAAITYAQLGSLADEQYAYQDAATWYLKALSIFLRYQNANNFMKVSRNYVLAVQAADPATQTLLRQRWTKAGLDQTITLDQLEQQRNGNT